MWWGVRKAVGSLVALRKESVDRNSIIATTIQTGFEVALRKESVDRNNIRIAPIDSIIESLSARRAWIEMYFMGWKIRSMASLSARRAWIEMRPYHL